MKKIMILILGLMTFVSVTLILGCVKANTVNTSLYPCVTEVNASGNSLAQFLNALSVESLWAKNHYVNWETGALLSGEGSPWATDSETHCSGFVGFVAARLNIPLLHAPFPSSPYSSIFKNSYGVNFPDLSASSDSLLATKQGEWLKNHAVTVLPSTPFTQDSVNDWVAVDAYTAQKYANLGYLAVVVYESATPSSPGHIAVIAPYQNGRQLGNYSGGNTVYQSFVVDGPYEAQSGGFNSSYTTISLGFAPPNGSSKQWFGLNSPYNLVSFYLYFKPISFSN